MRLPRSRPRETPSFVGERPVDVPLSDSVPQPMQRATMPFSDVRRRRLAFGILRSRRLHGGSIVSAYDSPSALLLAAANSTSPKMPARCSSASFSICANEAVNDWAGSNLSFAAWYSLSVIVRVYTRF